MQDMARYGRNGDTRMAHVAPGEMVVPREVLQSNPQVARGLGRAFQDVGADPLRYVVGSTNNSINPTTGEPEFFFDALLETLGNIATSDVGQAVASNVLSNALMGNKIDLKSALISGIVGGGLGALSPDQTLAGVFGFGDADKGAPQAANNLMTDAAKQRVQAGGTGQSDALGKEIAKTEPVSSGYDEGLLGIGKLFGLEADQGIGKMLNSKAGEALAMGLGAQLLSLFDSDEETQADRDFARRSRTYAERMRDPDTIRFDGPLMRNDGGSVYYPRRDGGIMPSEGSGTKDDVPAMLTAGEFVMTRDAVKGAGNGNLNQGIEKMYGMMDTLERKA